MLVLVMAIIWLLSMEVAVVTLALESWWVSEAVSCRRKAAAGRNCGQTAAAKMRVLQVAQREG